ncbi:MULTISPECIES: hypothetical protein [unclassified Microcoleus]|uniref:hypothetical protein n=1 Tax=unclassified Microcoleus TaxID=2642155 RepID=UPI002FD35B9D
MRKTFIRLLATLFFPFFLLDFGKAVFKLFVLPAVFDNDFSPLLALKTHFTYKSFSNFFITELRE